MQTGRHNASAVGCSWLRSDIVRVLKLLCFVKALSLTLQDKEVLRNCLGLQSVGLFIWQYRHNARVATVNTALFQLNVTLEYCGIWGGQRGKGTVFSRNNSVLPHIHHFANAPYSFIYLSQTPHKRCKWDWCWEAHLKRRTLNVTRRFV
jgi:hypothetical protein